MWNSSIKEHHEAWKHHKVPQWIHPEGVPLKKEYSEPIHTDHLEELKKVDWREHKNVSLFD